MLQLFAEVRVAKLHSNMYETAYQVTSVLKYPEKRKSLFGFEKECLITYNFDLSQNFD